MDSRIGINLKLFLKNKFCAITAFSLLIYISYQLIHFSIIHNLFNENYVIHVDLLLREAVRLSYLYFPSIGIISECILRQSRDDHFWEFSKSINFKKISNNAISVLILYDLIVFLIITILIVSQFMIMNHSRIDNKFIYYIVISIFVEYFLCGLMSVLASNAMAAIESKTKRYSIFFLFHFISGYPLYWLCNNMLSSINNNPIVNMLLNITEILSEDINFAEGYLYIGIFPSIHRVFIICFWIFFFWGIYLIIERKVEKKHWTILFGLFIAVGFLLLPYSKHNPYVSIRDQFDEHFEMAEKKVNQTEEENDFAVSDYDIELIPGLALNAKVTVTLNKEMISPNKEQFVFTLLENLHIKSVRDEWGHKLTYNREEDHITVNLPINSDKIIFFYSGTLAPFYADISGVYLPGKIAYYPIPGKHPVYVYGRGDNNVNIYMNQIWQENTHFKVKVYSLQKVYCSLSEIGKNQFEGDSDSFFLVSGLVEEDICDSTRIIMPALSEFAMEENRVEKESEIMKQYNEVLSEKGWDGLEGKTVFVSGFLNMTEIYNISQDYIEIPWLYPDNDFKDFYRKEIEDNLDAGN